jgi:hypothetical protein
MVLISLSSYPPLVAIFASIFPSDGELCLNMMKPKETLVVTSRSTSAR